ncbi:MAG: polymerase sigma factor FliA [Thermoanaerobacteraceae bacterium]|jgi:RNA polymerase sigma factor for flagellar operon FliA|nr:FliA/WhiG family RNA polymerase sigma factor [Biomaibacter acetigenes]MDK2877500.1 polymerase sigma factor FliA [Thermoanaerobacteraceae bacterium]MDN5312018.1 polymerase sigma factor FliA [Thermoanaerobacteraceae bacterium]
MALKKYDTRGGKMEALRADRLWADYNDTKDKKIKEQLVESYIPLIKHIVNRMAISLPSYIDSEDLISYGIFGLLQAIERYDASKGVKFETYAYARIKGSIIDELRKLDWIPQNIRKKAKLLQKAYAELEQSLGRTVKDEDICNYLNLSNDELQNLYNEIAFTTVLSFDDLLFTEDYMRESVRPDIMAEKKEVKRLLGQAINRLPYQEKLVITLYYYEGLTLKEISKVLELSQGRISQLHTKAILRLRGSLSRKRAIF